MNATKWIRIGAVAVAAAGLAGTVIANEGELSSKSDQSPTAIDSNSAAQLGWDKSAMPQRKGDSPSQRGGDNTAAQMGSGVNANPAAQLNNETQETSAPPTDSDVDTTEQSPKSGPDTGPESRN